MPVPKVSVLERVECIKITGGQAEYPIPKWITSPTWNPPPPCKQALNPCCKSQPEWTFKNVAIDESHWLFLTLTKIQTQKLVLNFKQKNLDSSSLSFCGCSGRTRKIKNNTKQSLWMSVNKRLSCCKSIYTWIYLPVKLFTNLGSLERDQNLDLN